MADPAELLADLGCIRCHAVRHVEPGHPCSQCKYRRMASGAGAIEHLRRHGFEIVAAGQMTTDDQP
jgi:hypothetical protein